MSALELLLLLAVVVAGVWLVGAAAELLVGRTHRWRLACRRMAGAVRARAAAGARFRSAARRRAPTR